MRKTQAKRQRIPRRGPGVAELEKILKEQEGQDSETQFQDVSPPPPPPSPTPPPFLFQPHHQSPSTPSLNPPPPPPPLPPPLPFLAPRDYSSWSDLPSFPNLGLVPPALPTAADAAEKAVFPTTPTSDTQMNIPPHFFPNFQFSASSLNRQYYNSMVNFIPGSASSPPSATSSAARYFHQIEHPSSQRSTDFNHTWTSPEEQEKMVISAKRPRAFLEESHRDPNFQSRRVPIFSVKESSSSSSSSLEMNRTAINLDSNLRFRGTKRGFAGQLMSSTKSSGSYQLAEDSSNLMALGSSSTPNQFAPFDFQETMEASQHRDEGGSASDYNKITFNSSLYESNLKSKSKGFIVATPEAEAEEDGIDLDLKL